MVNYGIAYGISAFGLAQRLDVPRADAATIIEQYFKQFPRIRQYMNDTIAFARNRGYVETVTGRRRYLRDIRSANKTVRSAAERKTPSTLPSKAPAADMIKLAMINIHRELTDRNLKPACCCKFTTSWCLTYTKPNKIKCCRSSKRNEDGDSIGCSHRGGNGSGQELA